MLEPLFHEAWIHRSGGHTVLGRKLHPFCSLDSLALEAVDSPFAREGGKCHPEDLLLAVWICSHDHPRSCCIENLELGDDGKAWVKEIRQTLDLKADCARFTAYIDDYYAAPDLIVQSMREPEIPFGCPHILSLVLAVCSQLRVPLYEAWTMPIGMLLWYAGGLEEMRGGDTRITTPDLRKELEHVDENVKVTPIEDGESLESIAQRCGIDVNTASVLSQQARQTRSRHDFPGGPS